MKQTQHKLIKKIGKNLRAIRIEKGILQADLARKAGISHSIISLLERELRVDIHLSTLYMLAVALDCDVCELMYGKEAGYGK
jgi:transcriptional regulator with XRE-family HTH domain